MLTEDFNPSGYIEIPSGATVTIDLNGRVINRNLTSAISWGIVIYNQGTLTIKDTSEGKTGIITGGYNTGSGGGIYNKSGILTIESGTIKGNKSQFNRFILDEVGNGAGIMIEAGTLNLYGGKVIDNISNPNNDSRGGEGSGIYIHNGAILNIKGAPEVIGNKKYNVANNLYLYSGITITIGDGGLTGSNGDIGISMESPEVFTSALSNATQYQIFTSDRNDYEIANIVVDTENKAVFQTCWMGLVNALAAGANVTLDAQKVYTAVDSDPCLTVPSEANVTLNLNGQTLDRKLSSAIDDGCAIKNLGTLTITGSGTIKGGKSSSGGGGIRNEGTLTISGGSIRDNSSTSLGGGVYNASTGNLTISGGTIESNTATSDGAGVYNTGTLTINSGGTIQNNTSSGGHGGGIYNTGTLTINSGGTISNNKVTAASMNGGGIYNAGTMSINGGTIQSNTAAGLGAGIYHDGATFNLQGSPTISSNSSGKNVYLTAAHHTITITADIGAITAIGINMENPSVFTNGLSGHGTYEKFTSEAGNSIKLTDNGSGEAELITYWNYLNRQITTDGTYTLESGKTYQAASGDPYLHVPSGRTVTINLNGQTLNRNLSSATDNGCVIFNEGNLTISGSGTISGGHNSDAGIVKGGGICNTGTLTITGGTINNNTTNTSGGGIYNTGTLDIQGGTIQSNTATNTSGGGIYHNGTTFRLQGSPTITNNLANNVANNVFLETGKTITITGTLNNSTAIGIASTESRIVFTTGLSGNGDASKFIANQTGKGIGLNSSGEAIIGPKITITRDINTNSNYAKLYIKEDFSTAQTAVYGERVKVKVWTTSGYIPVSLKRTTDIDFDAYPESGVDYEFDMPNSEVTISAVCRQGGYCGKSTEKDVKYALVDGTLTFIPKDASNYQMKDYEMGSAPWKNYNYTNVVIPKNLTGISAYAFCDNTKHLTAITVNGDNPNFKDVDGILFTKDGTTLICYPSGKTNLTSYSIPSGVTAISDGAFAFNTTLQSFTVTGGENFKAVNDVLYSYDEQILVCYPAGKTDENYTIAKDVTEIKPYAFQSATTLQYVYLLPTAVPSGGTHMFDGTTCQIMVIANILNNYKSASYWEGYQSRIQAIDMTSVVITLTDDPDAYDYSGTAVKPTVTQVKRIFDNYILQSGIDYSPITESSYTNNTALGTGTVTINGLGNYAGLTATKDFDITKRVVINGATGQYSTYYHTEGVTLSEPSGLQAFTISSINWETGATELSARISCIPTATPVLLWKSSNCNGTYHLKVVETASASPAADFKGVTAETPYNTLMDGNKAIYILKGGQFYRATSGSLPANHCYLAMPNSSEFPALSRVMFGNGEDGATGIDSPAVVPEDQNDWYSLDGRKLLGRPTQKGVYISNGKKVVIH